jgi:alpha,alpha-trehalase
MDPISRAPAMTAVKTLETVPSAWDHLGAIRARLRGRRLLVCLDYDGTLTPIVADHREAELGGDMRAAVDRLSRRCPVAIVSGRDLAMLRRLVPLERVIFAGSHGFEIAAADGSFGPIERGAEFLPELDAAEQALRTALAPIPGHSVERKRFSIAVHYRQVAPADEPALRALVDAARGAHPRLQRGLGKKVFELQPDLPWNKGEAVLWIAERLGFADADAVPLYLGDDITDEHAFRALAGRGLGIVVRSPEARLTAADYALADTEEVRRFLDMLSAIAERQDGGSGAAP